MEAQPTLNVSVNAPITIEGGGSTPEANQDLARRVSKELDATVRGVVVAEMLRQQRPGNLLNRGR